MNDFKRSICAAIISVFISLCVIVPHSWGSNVHLGGNGKAEKTATSELSMTGNQSLSGSTRAPAATYETGMSYGEIYFDHTAYGANFDVTGVTSREHNPYVTVVQSNPFSLAGPNVPGAQGVRVVKTIVSWNYLLNGDPPATDDIWINGTLVTGSLVGEGRPDLCWDKYGAASYIYSYPGAPAFINFNGGMNQIFAATDKLLGNDPIAYGEGLSILVVYDYQRSPLIVPMRRVVVYAGYTSTQSSQYPGFSVARLWCPRYDPDTSPIHFFINALDGQKELNDELHVNFVIVSGDLAGTDESPNAWQGHLGPNLPANNLYDHGDDLISPMLGTGDLLDVKTEEIDPDDCVGHSLATVSYQIGGSDFTPLTFMESWSPPYDPPSNPHTGDTLREIHPDYSELWRVLWWKKAPGQYYGNAILENGGDSLVCSFYDEVVMTVVDSSTSLDTLKMTYEGSFGEVDTLLDTEWKEIWPAYDYGWKVVVWNDNGDGHLSPDDHLVIALKPDLTYLRSVIASSVTTGAKITPTEEIPSLSRRGLAILIALLLTVTVIMLIRRRKRLAA